MATKILIKKNYHKYSFMLDLRLDKKAIFLNWQSALLLGTFVILRVLSFFISTSNIIQVIIIFALFVAMGLLFFKSPVYAFMLLLTEFFLGGSGNLFSFFGLSIRTTLILVFMFLWLCYALYHQHSHLLYIPHKFFYILLIIPVLMIFSFVNAILHQHNFTDIVKDLIPYLYFILFVPAYHLFNNQKLQEYFIRLVGVYVIGSALFSLYTFTLFVSGVSALHGSYYQWYRDIVSGKITYVTDFFYRIVTPEHMLLPFIMLIIVALLMRQEKHNRWWRLMFVLSAITLMLNFSRAYILGFLVGLPFLIYKHNKKKWLTVSIWSITILILTFVSINFVSSQGKNIGLEIVGLRIGSLITPQSETSSYTRTMLLTPIFTQIAKAPLLGQGIGSSITYYNEISHNYITTTQYDWGYFEMLAELGIVGTLAYLFIITILSIEIIKKIRLLNDYYDFYVGLLGSIIALLVINITTPIFFHVIGILFITLVMTFVAKPLTIFDDIVLMIYKIFKD